MVPFVIAFLVITVAAATQSLTGFGFALLAVPLLTLVFDPKTAVVAASIAAMFLTTGTTILERRHVRWRSVLVLLVAAGLGIPIGLIMLKTMSDMALRLLIALVALLCTLQVWRGIRFPANRIVVAGSGFLAGVLGASTGANGPPLIAAFQAMGYDPRQFRATMSSAFCFTGLLGLTGYLIAGEITERAAAVGLVAIPAVAIGWLVGNRLFARIDAERFRQVVLAALVISSVITGIRALSG
jgi:uncharacterized membrane protein YfcA